MQKENSFFGAYDANRMNEAINIIMSMLENGTDIYQAFLDYFAAQKVLFEEEADDKQQGFSDYIGELEDSEDETIAQINQGYLTDITAFKAEQESTFGIWFEAIRGRLNEDAAGELLNYCESLDERVTDMEGMLESHHYYAFILDEDSEEEGMLVDDDDYAILGEWILNCEEI